MKDIINNAKGKLNFNIFRAIVSIATIIYSIIGFKKSTEKKDKAIFVTSGIVGIAMLAKEIESDFKPVEDDIEEEA